MAPPGTMLTTVAPAVVIGGDLEALRLPLAFAVAAANVYFVYLLFQASGQVTPKAKTE